jgi:DNA helicase-2/ATP-dependent DNA helicase PcrA
MPVDLRYRTNAQSRPFEEQLRRRNIPYQIVGGISFYQRKEIKDLMAYLKLIVNIKDDVSFQRIINYPRRGIGEKTMAEIATVARREGLSNYEVVSRAGEYPELSNKVKKLQPFVELIEKYRKQQDTVAIDLLTQNLVSDLNLLEEFRSEDPIIGQTRIENVEAFLEGMAAYIHTHPEATLSHYLAEISLFTDVDTYNELEDKVTLMTIHSAKGLEYDTVFLVGLEEGLFPLERSIMEPLELEEERRLFYVAATRAKKKLYLSSATTRYRFGEIRAMPSRFIKEMPEHLLEKVDLRTQRYYAYESTSGRAVSSSFGRSRSAAASTRKGFHYDFEDGEGLQTGRLVHHPTFGRGKIIKTEGYGDSLTLEIMFTGIGVKKIMAKFGKLKIIG